MYPSHFTVTSTTFQLPLHSGTRCPVRTGMIGFRISHLPHRASGTVQTLAGWWCSRLLDTRVSHHPGNVSGAKVKNRLWWWFLVMMWFWIDDVFFFMLMWCYIGNIGQVIRNHIKIGRNHPNRHPKHYFHEYSCTGSSACEIWTHNSQ